MAKTSYLNLTNKILRRITQTAIADVTTATGHALIITNLINEAQIELFVEQDWYSLYTTRFFKTVTYTSDAIGFSDNGNDNHSITDPTAGLGSFEAGMEIIVSGSTSNDGIYVIDTVASTVLLLQSADKLTAEGPGEVTITAITYPVATNWGRTIDLFDQTNNLFLIEDAIRAFDSADPDFSSTSNPTHFTNQGDTYRFWPIPAGTYTIRDRYWKVPTTLAANTDTSDLPIEVENCILHWAWYNILQYLNKFEAADRIRIEFERLLKRAKAKNNKKISKMHIFGGGGGASQLHPPVFPPQYGYPRRRY